MCQLQWSSSTRCVDREMNSMQNLYIFSYYYYEKSSGGSLHHKLIGVRCETETHKEIQILFFLEMLFSAENPVKQLRLSCNRSNAVTIFTETFIFMQENDLV